MKDSPMATDQCPYAKSDMTPCVLKDGPICFAMDSRDNPICVGCERTPEALGVDPPADWSKQVADYHAKQKRRRR
jgi:hypothetical protein